MEQIILNIKNKSKIPFLRELLKHLEFVEVIEPEKFSAKEKEILNNIDEAVDFVNKYKNKEVESRSFSQLLNEL